MLLFALTAGPSEASTVAARTVACGGFPLMYGTTIGGIGPSATDQRPSSVMAVAAVTLQHQVQAKAWIVWDERGYAWLGLSERSPADLKRLWGFREPLRFTGPIRFTPTTKPLPQYLPKQYRLTDCPDALP